MLVMGNNKYNYNYNYNWRRQKEGNFGHHNQIDGGSRPRSHNSRRSSYGWQQSSWEIKFCATAGVPWQKVLDTKKYMSEDDKVLKWNDSAVKEAFLNAKTRFWAEMHGEPCDIKLPDPDIFIDKIDWEGSNVDPDLILDLEKRELDSPCETEKRDSGVVLGIPVIPEQYLLTPSGWGDAEDENPHQQNGENHGNGYDHWDDDVVNKERTASSREWDDGYVMMTRNQDRGRENRDNGSTLYSNKKKWDNGYKKLYHGDGSWNTSRYKISRFHRNCNNEQTFVDHYRHKRGNFASERPLIMWRPVTRQ